MNTDINKIIHIDGTPGITLEGLRGGKGKNGGMLFFTDGGNTPTVYSIFDMWPNNYVSSTPSFTNKHNYCESIMPAARDYVLTHVQNMAYVYIINNVIDRSSLVAKNLDQYVEAHIITREYADKIIEYYTDNARHDCCLVTEISSLTFLANVPSQFFDLELIKTTFNLNYVSYSGVILDNTNAMGTTQGLAEFIVFNILAPDNTDIKNIRIEAEFYTDNVTPEMSSIYPALWSNPSDANVLSMNYPSGYLENYSYKINYDDENLENFTVILKDFGEGVENVKKLPLNIFNNYSIYIYAYIPESSDTNILNKYYITEFQGNDLIY